MRTIYSQWPRRCRHLSTPPAFKQQHEEVTIVTTIVITMISTQNKNNDDKACTSAMRRVPTDMYLSTVEYQCVYCTPECVLYCTCIVSAALHYLHYTCRVLAGYVLHCTHTEWAALHSYRVVLLHCTCAGYVLHCTHAACVLNCTLPAERLLHCTAPAGSVSSHKAPTRSPRRPGEGRGP